MFEIYKGKKVLITGIEGFKGSWLALWLNRLGANIIGISKNYSNNNKNFKDLNLKIKVHNIDLINYNKLEKIIIDHNPDIIFHLAAQPIVSVSYLYPKKTLYNNIISSINILEIVKNFKKNISLVYVTSDKVYKNLDLKSKKYSENDSLGGHDPYSVSKSCSDLIFDSYRISFFKNKNIYAASLRSGNVIGGGDWSKDRLFPDIFNSIIKNDKIQIRNMSSIRPWIHVLDVINAYLLIGEKLLQRKSYYCGAWNISHNNNSNITVKKILEIIKKDYPFLNLIISKKKFDEKKFLNLNSTKIHKLLKWKPILSQRKSILLTINWYLTYIKNKKNITNDQLLNYLSLIPKRK